MKSIKPIQVIFTWTILLIFTFSACNADEKGLPERKETGMDLNASQKDDVSLPVTLDLYVNYDWWDKTGWGEDMTSREITRITGVSLNISKPANTEESVANLNLMLSSGNYPDMIMLEDGILKEKLLQQGVFLPLDDLIHEHGPDILKNVGLDFLQKYCMESDGKIYGLPNGVLKEGDFPAWGGGVLILQGVYKKLGSPPLNTTEDLYRYLVKVRDSGIKNRKEEKVIPSIFDWASQSLAGSFGVQFFTINGGSYAYGQDGTLKQVLKVPRMKEVFHYTSRLFREQLIDQEWLLQPVSVSSGKIISGRIAVYFSANAYGWLDEYNNKVRQESGDSFMLIKTPLAEGAREVKSNFYSRKPWNKIYITKDCQNSVRAMQFLNWQASEQGQYVTRIGPEGVVWNRGTDGKPVVTSQYLKKLEDGKDDVLSEIGYMKWCFQQNNNYLEDAVSAFMSEEEREERKQRTRIIAESLWTAPELERLYLDPTSVTGIMNTKINTYFTKMDKHLYMAQNDSSFEAIFVQTLAEMERLGLSSLEEELNRQIQENRKSIK